MFSLHLLFFLSGTMLKYNIFFEFKIGPFPMTFCFDWISWYFGSFVLLISCLVLVYSNYYMMGDQYYKRFILMLLLFVLSMVVLIFSGSVFTMMVGWDGLGIVSFSLVIYYSDKDALVSGLVTIFTNRIGDALMLISIFAMVGSWNFMSFKGGLFFTIGAMTKSAQLPFSAWLPAAMSAPTPISALVHSSTLVTAGVYMMIRLEQFLSIFGKPLGIFSLGTMLGAGIVALLEKDFKKIIAMSTLSQLGLMFFLLAIGAWKVCFFHMVCHAIFKSMMFLSAGTFIMDGDQDTRKKGSMMKLQPFSSTVLVFASLSLMGTPFFSGFFSKDLALDLIFSESFNIISYFLFFLGCIFTVLYSMRLMFPSISKMFSQNESMFNSHLMTSLPMLLIWAAVAGKFLSKSLFMEEFNLISFPMKMVGLIIIFSGTVFFSSQLVSFKKIPVISLAFLSGHFSSQTTLMLDADSTYTEKGSKISFSNTSNFLLESMKMEKETFLIWLFPLFLWGLTCML
uniref:NADH-ubiquinone oxidoreductase chain 5 n=1 Tax=Leptotrombidium deliense TaxID=299467 RepID=Q3C2J5_9ACAR|nr:NADH dehydrogenase subunit 5 [Leptotrombidium deliense]BAE47102.1 NADH dehydrogenase subunit 5 [Leptotrombidium deliense]